MTLIAQFATPGGPEQLRLVEVDAPTPGPGEALIAVRAAGMNRAELLFLANQYLMPPPSPSLIGVEAVGTVVALGDTDGGTSWGVGDDVCVTPNLSPDQYGVMGTHAIVPIESLESRPTGFTDVQAAAFWMAYGTAYGGLVERGGLRAGADQVVLITAASSSVGIAAVQVAKAHGATVIVTTRSDAKSDRLRSIGADHVIVTNDDDLPDRVAAITDGRGFDVAFDPIAGPFLDTLASAAARGATIVEYGGLSGEATPLPLFALIGGDVTVRGFHLVFDVFQQPAVRERVVRHLLDGAAAGTYDPVIDSTYRLDDVVAAYEHMSSNEQFGKLVVEMATD